MPRNVKEIVGPSTFDSLMGALMLLHKETIDCKFSEHCCELAGPAVKSHPNSAIDAEHHKNAAGSNGWQLIAG